jgi:hypothetical protein
MKWLHYAIFARWWVDAEWAGSDNVQSLPGATLWRAHRNEIMSDHGGTWWSRDKDSSGCTILADAYAAQYTCGASCRDIGNDFGDAQQLERPDNGLWMKRMETFSTRNTIGSCMTTLDFLVYLHCLFKIRKRPNTITTAISCLGSILGCRSSRIAIDTYSGTSICGCSLKFEAFTSRAPAAHCDNCVKICMR